MPVSSKKERGERKDDRGEKRTRKGEKREAGYTRLFINLGKTDGFYPGELMQFLNKHVGGRVEVGHIDLLQKYAYFDVPEEDARRVMKSLNGQRYKGREVRCNDADDAQKPLSKPPKRAVKREEKAPQRKFKKNDWQQLMKTPIREFKGEMPDFTEEGWARRRPKKK